MLLVVVVVLSRGREWTHSSNGNVTIVRSNMDGSDTSFNIATRPSSNVANHLSAYASYDMNGTHETMVPLRSIGSHSSSIALLKSVMLDGGSCCVSMSLERCSHVIRERLLK